eukprot:m.298530 g.298530  ORF g.298530 m.298530 type:complete len:189 (+) comp16409_c1_seq21:859-1425(+)
MAKPVVAIQKRAARSLFNGRLQATRSTQLRELKKLVQVSVKAASGGFQNWELGVVFVSPKFIQQQNKKYSNLNLATDVLSFPTYDFPCSTESQTFGSHLGDILVCPKKVSHYAMVDNADYLARMVVVLVHGVMHLLGHDHQNEFDAKNMVQAEANALLECSKILKLPSCRLQPLTIGTPQYISDKAGA